MTPVPLPMLEGRIAAVLRRAAPVAGTVASPFARVRVPVGERATVDSDGLLASADWHRGRSAQWSVPEGTHSDRAILAQSEGNIANLRSLNLDLKRPWGAQIGAGDFGENIWIEGSSFDATCLHVGDLFQVLRYDGLGPPRPSGLELEVSSPRGPCGRVDQLHGGTSGPGGVAAACAQTGLGGWFFRVRSSGDVQEGDVLRLIARPQPSWTLQRVASVLNGEDSEVGDASSEERKDLLRTLASMPELARFEWRDDAKARIMKQEDGGVDPVRGALIVFVITALSAFLYGVFGSDKGN